MTQQHSLAQVTHPLTQDQLLGALLEITGDLDKAMVLQATLPPWLIKAKPEVLKALEDDYRDSQFPRERALRLLKQIKPLDEFCREKLKAYLAAKGLGSLDLDHDLLEIPWRTISGISPLLGGMLIETQTLEHHSLLQAAMQNFPASRAEPDGLPQGTVIRQGAKGEVLASPKAHEFIGYCRELDVGEAYQAHLREHFNLPGPDEAPMETLRGYNPAVSDIGQSRCSDMKVDLHIACAKGDIAESTYGLLLKAVNTGLAASQLNELLFNGRPLVWHGLKIRGACVWSVLVFCGNSQTDFVHGPLVVYMPKDPLRPLFEYSTLHDFSTYLTSRLEVASYRSAFAAYLDESERLSFFEQFDKDKNLDQMDPLPVLTSLTTFFFNSCVGKLQLDARELAVPVADVDEDARKQRLQRYLNIGLTLLNVAGLVVPALGQLMMGVAVGELLGEVFEGVEDWKHRDNAHALEHLINVAQSIASMALFATGVQVVGGVARRVLSRAPDFFEGVEAVSPSDDAVRLWRRSSTPYRQPLTLEGKVASPKGVYQANGQSYVKIDGGVYSIAYDERIGRWRARHPKRDTAYRPSLQHNGQGGWQFAFERPEEWDNPNYILQRLDPSLASLPEGHLQDIAAITDMTLARLQQLARQNRPLSERFHECALRFEYNQEVRDLRWQMEHDAPLDPTTAKVQMMALPFMEGWPKGRFFEVLDPEGYVLERHPDTAPFDYEDLSIHLTEQQLKEGEVMSTTLAALDHEEKALLLGGAVESGAEHGVLKQRLMASLQQRHRQVYEALYQNGDVIDQTDHGLLKGHYPQLPLGVSREVVGQASAANRWRLRQTGRVPLRLAQQAREALDTLVEDQALIGLYLPELANDATRRMVLGLAPGLEGWPADLRLQLRDGSPTGRLLGQVGSDTATASRTLVKVGADFQAFDETGAPLGIRSNGREGLYQALVDALLPVDLAGMDVQSASQLRYRITEQAQKQRRQLSRFVWPERAEPKEMPASCIQSWPGEPARFPRGLVRKVRKLYPSFNDQRIATFLQALGTDHLSRARAVKALKEQFEQLRRALGRWARERVASTPAGYTSADYRLSRLQAVQAIESSWQHASLLPDELGEKVPGLMLDGMALGSLPTLPPGVNFDHVQRLSLNHMGLDDDVAYFLKHFKQLRTLELSDNQLTRLPEVLSRMPELKRVYLDSNRLQLTEHTRVKLAGLTGLTLLNLNNNPLIDPPAISKMFDLRTLALRNCRLRNVPVGLLRLPYLEHVDLRENDLLELPDWLFSAPRTRAEVINLRHNPLGLRSRQLLRNYRNNVGVGMGFLEDDIARLNEQKARELWLADEWLAHYSQRSTTWSGLRDEPGSDGLFKLLAELGGTADSTHVREDLEHRVWRVLEAASAHAELREEVFERAATPLNCDDAAATSFSNLEVLVEIHEAAQQVEGGHVTAQSLLRLGRGLFRLDRLERMAQTHSTEHPTADPLEVSLAYRTGLVDKFYLPGQPRHMRFSRLAGVSQAALNTAELKVKADELSPRLIKFLMELPFWTRYLKRTSSASFDALNEPFDQRMQTVFDQSLTLDDVDYRDQMNEILREQGLAEKAEIERLTLEALKLDETPQVCALPIG
ncbi:NEL-type E3 ubiquitin ligase domain-containing protein [Pseudomonas sp. SR18]|uniref:NEL-type E3 ubiquitin ligase domain-containing protein n=1 Tax=Pseudomonas sp. SR18 TaxID=1461074 RepID=UPI0020340466|nr:NEL-type E3 ubiquitin ligase domain-containing protein [Pseudomonas sp. SR18]MCM2360554.1 hypothetical protein [Pseudomonas sp. SR18]